MYDNKQQQQDRQVAVHAPKLDYYHRRIAELGLSENEARHQYGFRPTPEGDISLTAYGYGGGPITFLPKENRKAYTRIREQKSTGESHEDRLVFQYSRTRVHPDRLASWQQDYDNGRTDRKPAKYLAPKGQNVPPFPMPAARLAYQQGFTGGPICFIEGEFKGAALDRAGIETVAFGGISIYRLDYSTRDYLTIRRPDVILVAYDGDALDVRRDASGQITDKRTRDFYKSAARFTHQLVNHLASIEHKAKIVWCAVNPDHPEKGADDLLAAAEDPLAAVGELARRIEGENWTFTKLAATTYEARLKARFNLESAERFHQANAAAIGQSTFTFSGLKFRMEPGGLVMLSDPFSIEVPTTRLTIDNYLSDEREALDKILHERTLVAIQSDTGTGKTTYLIEWAKRTGRRLVITVPTRSLCRQLAKSHSIFAVYGSGGMERVADAAAAQIVVATYDTVHHLSDLAERVLVIDEAHNLVNQYGQVRRSKKLFRARALNRLQTLAATAAKVVYLSGTMPRALLKTYDVPLVDVRRRNSPTVRLHRLTAHNSKNKAATVTLLSQLVKDIEANPHQVHVVLFNNTKQLKKIRALIAGAGHLQHSEIQLLSRTTYDAGETSAFDDLENLQQIRPGVRLVLTTCIIAEGVNIENTNVGNVYAVGVKCPDTVRQFAARFREMVAIDLYLILPPEGEPGPGFSRPTAGDLEYLTAQATAAAIRATRLSQAGHADHYDRSDTFRHIMPNESGDGFVVDHLAILATERDRLLATAPPSYTVGRLLDYDGFELATPEQVVLNAKMEAGLKKADEVLKEARDAAVESMRGILPEETDKAVAGLKIHYQRTKNREAVNRLDVLAADLTARVHDLDALTWTEEHEDQLAFPEVRELIRRAAQLHFAGVIETGEWLALTAREWNKTWQQIKTAYGLQALTIRSRGIPAGLRLDLLAKMQIAANLDNVLTDTNNTITDTQLAELIRDAVGRSDKREGMHRAPCLVRITKGRAVQLIESIYQIESTRHGTKKILTIGAKHSEVPTGQGIVATCLSLKANPLKIKDLTG